MIMKKKMLWKDAGQAITHSFGRWLAILLLMAVSAFALIGLKMTGPDMRQTATSFFAKYKLADVTVMSNYGLDKTDRKIIKSQSEIKEAAFGYLQDSRVSGKNTDLRIYSISSKVSASQLVSGRQPKKDNEIALSYLLKGKYKLGQTISLQTPGNLKEKKFKITGFIRSSESIDRSNIGQTTAGDGQLDGVAEVAKSAFKKNTPYAIARIRYKKAASMYAYSSKYRNYVADKQEQLQRELKKHGKKRYSSTKNKLKAQEAKLSSAKQKLKEAQKQLKAQAAALPAAGQALVKQEEKKLTKQGSQLAGQEKQLKKAKQTLKQTGKVTYTVSDRSANPGYAVFQSNSERVDILANVFPVLLFAIAALVSLTTMIRFVEEERISIGTFKALGYSNRDAALKFILFSASASLLGVGIGAAGGYTFLPKMIFEAYVANSTISNCQLLFNWQILLLTTVIALACTTGAALLVLKRDLADKPASLLLPKPPKNGSRILLERFTPLWKRLSFNYKVTMRNLFRYKSRAFMTIFGVAGCCGLLVMGFGIQDSLSGISNIEYSRIITYDLIAVKKKALTNTQKDKLDSALSSESVKKHASVHFEELTKKAGSDATDQSISLVVPTSGQSLSGYISLKNRASGQKLPLKDKGAVISEKLAKLLNDKVGSYIKLKDEGGDYRKIKVTGICEMYIGHYVFMNKSAYKQAFGEKADANAQLITLKKGQSLAKYSEKLMKTGAVQGINQNTSNKETIDNTMGSLNEVMIILIGMATLLALVVIYNLSNINVEERIRELSTIKVLGFFDQETTLYIYRETIILSIIGILCGYLAGIGLHTFIITSLPPDNAMFDPAMKISNFLYSALIPAVITALVALIMHKKIKSVNMLDALKSVD